MRKTLARLGVAASIAALTLTAAQSASAVTPQGKARGATTVTLNTGTIGYVVTNLGLTPAAVGPGVLGGTPLQASFPIVGNLKGGVIKHTGGLSLTAGSTTLTLTNYDIDTTKGVLTAEAAVNGAEVGRLPLFDLGAAAPQQGCAATAELTLDEAAAKALTAVFGAPPLAGTDFGSACVAPRG